MNQPSRTVFNAKRVIEEEVREVDYDEWLRRAAHGHYDSWLDRKGGSDFSLFAGQWPHWLYGAAQPNEAERARLRRAYLRWGRRCVATPRLTRMRRPVGGNR